VTDEIQTGSYAHIDKTNSEQPGFPPLELDPAKYLSDMADFDMTETQKVELLRTLWSIMRSFVELGFSVDICAQLLTQVQDHSETSAAGVEPDPSSATETLSDNTTTREETP